MNPEPLVFLSPDPGELSSGETEELQRIKWHRKQLLEDIQVCSPSHSQILMLFFFFFFFFCVFGPPSWLLAVPWLGSESERPLPAYTTAPATLDL